MSSTDLQSLNHKQCLELAQLCHSIKRKHSSKLQRFVEKNPRERVNLRIPDNAFFRDFMPELIGDTLLHVAHRENDVNAYRLLLSFGADFTLKDADGSTVVHRIVENSWNDKEDVSRGRLKNPFLAATLFAHYEYGVHRNPVNRRGITHLHAACMANSVDTVHELLSHAGADANEAVNVDSKCFCGYTPMHFAARYSELCTLETMRILVKHGADVNVEDASGATPLDLLIDRRTKIVEAMESRGCERDLTKALVGNEKVIGFLVSECGVEGFEMV